MDTPTMDVFQFIDSKGDFDSSHEENKSLVQFLNEKANFTRRGMDYSVVAILGPQSSGKSTLLNILFGTRFDVMNEQLGRSQTTQGVWIGVSQQNDDVILVLDVEGTDGRERGEDDVAFERKSSLFSLAVSSLLIINMWCQDVGRYQAANLALLKTVFEMNLQLFQKSDNNCKTLLLFVIRDHHTTPLARLEDTLRKDLDKIWNTITKPPGFENSSVLDFFDFDFVGLPHKFLAAAEFQIQAIALKERFRDHDHPKYFLQQKYNKEIPADGFSAYAYGIWNVIKSNKDLDIPSQKEMLATYRCEEIMSQAMVLFEKEIAPIRFVVNERGEHVEKFGAKATRILDNTLNEYDMYACRYDHDVSSKKRAVLSQRVITELGFIFERLVTKLRSKAMEFFDALVQESFGEQVPGSRVTIQFSSIVEGIKEQTFQFFDGAVKEALPLREVPADWSWTNQFVELQGNVATAIERLRKEHLQQLILDAKTSLESNLAPAITHILESTEQASQIWPAIRKIYEVMVGTAETELRPKLNVVGLNDDEQLRRLGESLRGHGPAIVRKCAKDAAQHISLMMEKRFDELFNFDENKLPRRWKRRDDIPKLFKVARQRAEELVEIFSFVRLSPADDNIEAKPIDDDPRTIIPMKERNSLLERFRATTNAAYKTALQEQEAAKAAGMNPLFLILLLVLGWNELLYILSWIIGPLLVPLLLIVGIGAYIGYAKLGMGGPAGQLIDTMAKVAVKQSMKFVGDTLASFNGNNNANVGVDNHEKND